MNKTMIFIEVTVPSDDNKLLNDVVGMIARLKCLLNHISGVTLEYTLFEMVRKE